VNRERVVGRDLLRVHVEAQRERTEGHGLIPATGQAQRQCEPDSNRKAHKTLR
jgi:hypothetical protein